MGKTGNRKKGGVKKQLQKDVLQLLRKEKGKTLNHKQISSRLGITDKDTRKLIISVLNQLSEDGQVKQVQKGKYKFIAYKSYVEGVVDMTSTGSAYVVSEETEEDIFISTKHLGHALNGDLVKVFVYARRKRRKPEGEIIEILKRKRTEFVGKMEISPKFAFLVPDDNKMYVDLYIPLDQLKGAKDGEKAIARITDWPKDASSPFGEITEILGDPGDNEVEIHSILAGHGLPYSFPGKVEQEAEKIPLEITEDEIERRRDFRKVTTFTIDPPTAQDFDDALSVRKLKNGNFEVGVHIADVTHYVKEGDMIDKEGAERATSIYLVDRVVPMLPEVLSNQVCSLRPNEEKLTFSVVFEFKANGEVVDEWMGKTIIYSDRRFTYDEVQDVIDTGLGDFSEQLLMLNSFAKTLRTKRIKKGSIAFEKIEVGFLLDEEGGPADVFFKEQKDANKLIEEFMLLANKAVAAAIGKKKDKRDVPKTFVYRVHDTPAEEKINAFAEFISRFGYKLDVKDHNTLSNSINEILSDVKGKREENMIETLAIRTMAKAFYSTKNLGHYGLNFRHYSHFTSPIRRYPDLITHRLLHHYLNGGKSVDAEKIEDICRHSSEMERKAIDAERDSTKFFQVLFLKNRVGEDFEGIISGVSEWGIFVELLENKCEGMIRLKDMDDDYYTYEEENYRIIGNNHKRVFQLGDNIRIRIKKADLVRKFLDFELAEEVVNEEMV